jgi:hypothetical protein
MWISPKWSKRIAVGRTTTTIRTAGAAGHRLPSRPAKSCSLNACFTCVETRNYLFSDWLARLTRPNHAWNLAWLWPDGILVKRSRQNRCQNRSFSDKKKLNLWILTELTLHLPLLFCRWHTRPMVAK